jgi:hypothetical protein
MTVWKFAAGCVVAATLGTPALCADSINGRWAKDLSSCTRLLGAAAQSPLIVTENALRWSSDVCRIARSYKADNTVHIQAMCWGESGERSIPVSLRQQSGRLTVIWDRGPRGELRRCP